LHQFLPLREEIPTNLNFEMGLRQRGKNLMGRGKREREKEEKRRKKMDLP
jgi:hypothetical protein